MIHDEQMVREGLLFRPIEWSRVRKVVLIGFRGAGKSLMAHQLAAVMNWPVVSTDNHIEKQLQCSIAEFVSQNGWEAFRHTESAVINQLGHQQGIIIDTGGGVVERKENMAVLSDRALIIWVDAPPEVIIRRLKKAGDRPLLSEHSLEADVREHYQKRYPLYRKYAHLYVDTSRPETKKLVLTFIRQMVNL